MPSAAAPNSSSARFTLGELLLCRPPAHARTYVHGAHPRGGFRGWCPIEQAFLSHLVCLSVPPLALFVEACPLSAALSALSGCRDDYPHPESTSLTPFFPLLLPLKTSTLTPQPPTPTPSRPPTRTPHYLMKHNKNQFAFFFPPSSPYSLYPPPSNQLPPSHSSLSSGGSLPR